MLNHSRVYKLKQLEIALEISLVDETETKAIIESSLDKLVEMNNEGLIDSSERHFILKSLKDIIFEDEIQAKNTLGNCAGLLDYTNKTARMLEMLNKNVQKDESYKSK